MIDVYEVYFGFLHVLDCFVENLFHSGTINELSKRVGPGEIVREG